jgi:predicted dehydrogenase
MKKYTVAQVGLGNRGRVHFNGFLANPDRFEVVALCDLDEAKMRAAAEEAGVEPRFYTDAETMLAEARPDIFCFVTQPALRLPMVELAAKYEVRGLAMEKPMALSLLEAAAMVRLCRDAGIRAVVSHQQKYLFSLQSIKRLADEGEIGEIVQVDATCQPFLAQLGTHYMDYILWANGGSRAQWVVGHLHGRGLLTDSHPSPDYCLGHCEFENGVRSFFEFGRLAPAYMAPDKFWLDNRLTIRGTAGFLWGDTDDRWGGVTKSRGAFEGEPGPGWDVESATTLQPAYLRELADWLDDETQVHSCNIETAYHGYEILEAMCVSALDQVRVDLPLDPAGREEALARMRRELPECPERE